MITQTPNPPIKQKKKKQSENTKGWKERGMFFPDTIFPSPPRPLQKRATLISHPQHSIFPFQNHLSYIRLGFLGWGGGEGLPKPFPPPPYKQEKPERKHKGAGRKWAVEVFPTPFFHPLPTPSKKRRKSHFPPPTLHFSFPNHLSYIRLGFFRWGGEDGLPLPPILSKKKKN